MDTKEITYAGAITAIDELVTGFTKDKSLDSESLSTTTYIVENNIQFRDYFMGLPIQYGLSTMINLADAILLTLEKGSNFGVALNTILGAWVAESGDTEEALKYLGRALEINPQYSLAHLLTRVVKSGNYKMLAVLRAELHPKVLEGLEESPNSAVDIS